MDQRVKGPTGFPDEIIFKQINYFLISPLLLQLNSIKKLYSKVLNVKKLLSQDTLRERAAITVPLNS